MAIRDKIAANAAPYLAPGEQTQAVMAGQTMSQFLILVGVLPFLLANAYRTIVVTDRRVLIFDSGKMSQTKAKRVLGELPRNFLLGPPNGTIWHKVQIGSETVRIHKRFHQDFVYADQFIVGHQG